MKCDCNTYVPLELIDTAISRRIKQSKALRKRLAVVAEHGDLLLMRCPECAQMWQSGREWAFSYKEYFFQVPDIETNEWLTEPYAQPAAMLTYSAMMSSYWEKNHFVAGDNDCKKEGCNEKAVQLSVFCIAHHIESLQQIRVLPSPPPGRLFPPYH
jgi:hypothetical protein